MSLLDSNQDALGQAADFNFRFSPSSAPETGTFHNFGSSSGNAFMRSMATAGRSVSLAISAIPVAVDAVTSRDSVLGRALGDKGLGDRYFGWHDEFFGDAVDHWTPRPQEVGAAGQIAGELTGGIVKFLANPAFAVADAQLSTGEDLVRQGVGAGTAQVAGGIAGLSNVIGIKAPAAVGNTLTQRVLSGGAINVVQSAAAAKATQLTLEAGDAPPGVVDQFNPLDPRARTVDSVMGLVFGAMAHVHAHSASMTQTQRDALSTLAQAGHLEESSLPGRPASPADLTTAVNGTRMAMGQMLRGEPVAVDEPLPHFAPDPAADAFRAQMAGVVEEAAPHAPPIEAPHLEHPDQPPQVDEAAAARPAGETPAPEVPHFDESVRLPTGDFDPATGAERTVSANEHVARAAADAEQAKAVAPNLFQTAASCLLGTL